MQKAVEWVRFGRLCAIAELAVVLMFILLQIWIFQRKTSWCIYVAAILIICGWVIRKESFETLGLVGKKWYALAALAIFLAKVLPGHPLVSLISNFHVSVHATRIETVVLHGLVYFLWAMVQQLVLNGFFMNRLQCITGGRYLPAGASIIFGTVHIPNPILMVAAAVGGGLASYVFLKMKNLYLIALAHAAIGMMIFSLHINMRVGPGYYFYQ